MSKVRNFLMCQDNWEGQDDVEYAFTILQAKDLDELAEQVSPENVAEMLEDRKNAEPGVKYQSLIEGAIYSWDGAVIVYEIVPVEPCGFVLKDVCD
jgi:hypothetical protein